MRMKPSAPLLFLAAAALAAAVRPSSPAAPALQATLQSATISVGEKAVLIGTTAPGAALAISGSGPAPVPSVRAEADARGAFRAEIGPFERAGTYGIVVVSGADRQALFLDVLSRPAAGVGGTPQAAAFNEALSQSISALKTSLDGAESALGGFPADDPGIIRARAGLPRLRTLYLEIEREIFVVLRITPLLSSALASEPDVRPQVPRDLDAFYETNAAALRQGTERLSEYGGDAISRQSDWCARAAVAGALFKIHKSILGIVSQGLSEFITEKLQLGFGGSTAAWIGNAFLSLMPHALQPDRERLWENLHSSAEALSRLAGGGPLAAAMEVIGATVGLGLDEYIKRNCVVFKGTISGHTHVEALDHGEPFYALDNDWVGDVYVTAARTAGGSQAPVRGLLTGRARNLKATNRLLTLYPKVAWLQPLTVNPSPIPGPRNLFIIPLEGEIGANSLTLRLGSGGLDLVASNKATLGMIVIPRGSPVPIVQKFDVPFQGGRWQVQRAFGPDGSVTQAILREYDGFEFKRQRVRTERSRDISTAGAKGTFTLKIDLCAGCED